MFEINYNNNFKKDIKLAKKRGKDLNRLRELIKTLEIGLPLMTKYKDHMLIGDYKGRRECHIESNWLLIYRIEGNLITLERLGSHADLFE